VIIVYHFCVIFLAVCRLAHPPFTCVSSAWHFSSDKIFLSRSIKRNINVSHYLQTMLRGGSKHYETCHIWNSSHAVGFLGPKDFPAPNLVVGCGGWLAGWLVPPKGISSSAVE
jgi:hypothetical protein